MHELGIAASVLDAVRTEVGMRPGYRAVVVGLRVGTLAGLDPESLRFGFEAMVKDSDLDPLRLEVENAEADELDIAWIELEETS
ncbi:MAG TPA: hydrogenase maturation nickel metallochaperone HypA [Thermoanaerobaculia bacterium]|nr:hydrogenase maturation nickel metallochaperone HypA [Thermoanaerobaculia bacterium]